MEPGAPVAKEGASMSGRENHPGGQTDAIGAPARQSRDVELALIRLDFGNHRWETSPTKSLEELSQSMAEYGLLQRPRLRPHPAEEGAYQVVYGHRRVMAAKLLGWRRIPAEIMAVEEDSAVRALQMQENIRHLALSPIEEAIGMEQMVRLDTKTQKKVAAELEYDPSEVKRRLDLLKLSAGCVEQLHTGKIKPAHGAVLHKHLKGDEARQDEFAGRVVSEKLSAEVLEQYIKEDLEGEEEEEPPGEIRIPPMGPTPTTVYRFAEGVLPEEGKEGEANEEQGEFYARLGAIAALIAFNDHELRSTELGLPLPYVPADVAEIVSYVMALSVEDAEDLRDRLVRRFFEAGHRAKLMPEQIIAPYMREELSAPPAGSEKP